MRASRGVPPSLSYRFQVDREVGRGGAGVVYAAYDNETSRPVALKVLPPSDEASDLLRFEREAETLSAVSHPNVVELVGHGLLEEGGAFIAMEWIDGETLCDRIQRSPPSLAESLEFARQLASALGAAHDVGVVHRDVKPANLLITKSNAGAPRLVLVDFGVAAAGDVRLTLSGQMVGTPAYMAPEQARGDAVDARSDLFALGAVLFELICGRPPHVGPTPIATLARLVTTEAPRLTELAQDIPEALDDLVARLLATKPVDRPGDAREVLAALSVILAEVNEAPTPGAPQASSAPGSIALSSGSRLVTTIVCLSAGEGDARREAMDLLTAKGALIAPVGRDGMVGHFGALQATGDEAGQAVEVALSLAKLGARVGVATGRTRVQKAKPQGEVVDRASAFAREADHGQVIADATTTELLRGRYELSQRSAGSAFVRAAREGKREGGGAPFIARETELSRALGAYERCVESKNPVVVSCVGPPGIGKTRLGREILARTSAARVPARAVVIRCESFAAGHGLSVAADVLRAMVGIARGASLVVAAAAIDARLGGTIRSSQNPTRDLVAKLLANEPLDDGARDALWPSMTDMFLSLLASQPLALVVEDTQWADPESVAFLSHVLGRAEGRSLYLLLLVRPQFFRDHPGAMSGREHVRIELRPVSRKASRAIAKAMLGERATDEILDRIAEQAEGSPLFAEELARLTAAGRDASKAPTIEAAIQASLDALAPEHHEAALRLSTFGLFGWDGGLRALGIEEAEDKLSELAASEIVVEHAESRFGSSREWGFKHALVREVAYASLDPADQKTLHAAAARWLSDQGEDAATVARHFELGGLSDDAGEHWERAARRALATNALSDAVTMSERALAFAYDKDKAFPRALLLDEAFARVDAKSGERETSVRALIENAYDEPSRVRAEGARARFDDACGRSEQMVERLIALRNDASQLELWDEEAKNSAVLATRYAFAGRFVEAEAEAGRLLTLADLRSNPNAAVDAWQTLAIVRQTRGDLLSALDARRSAVKAAAQGGLRVREATLTINVGFALTTIGAQRESRAAIEQGLQLAEALGSPGVVELGRMVLLGWASTFGSDAVLDRLLQGARSQADNAADGGWTPNDRITLGLLFYRGVELLRQGGGDAAVRAKKLLSAAAEAYRATGMRDVLPVALGEWSEAERRLGHVESAVLLAKEAATLLDHEALSLLNEAPIYLALHDAHVDAGDIVQAKEAIVRAMPALSRRLSGLSGSGYALGFLTRLPHNAALLSAADAYGLVPRDIEDLLEKVAR